MPLGKANAFANAAFSSCHGLLFVRIMVQSMQEEKTTEVNAKAQQSPKDGFYNILFGVILPVLILNKMGSVLGAVNALLLALSLPILYGAYEYYKKREHSFIAILGFLNVLISGGLALWNQGGIWFAIKEAAFPLLIGLFVMGSGFWGSPFIKKILLNPGLMNLTLIDESIKKQNTQAAFDALLKKSNLFLSLSFFFSAFLNFVIAQGIFLQIDSGLSEEAKQQMLNEQMAEMTYKGMILIAIPSFVILLALFFYFTKNLQKLTGQKLDALIEQKSP